MRIVPARMTIAVILVALFTGTQAGCTYGRSQVVLVKGFPQMSEPPHFVRSWPPYGAQVPSPPNVVTVELAEPIGEGSDMSIWLSGRRVDNHDGSVMIGTDKKLQVTLKTSQGAGLYRVDYTVVWRGGGSSDGRFYFRVEPVRL